MLRAFDAEVARLPLDDARLAVVSACREACHRHVGEELPVETQLFG